MIVSQFKLSFGKANAKLVHLEKKTGKKVFTFSILSGYNCPGAKDCQSFAVENKGKLSIRDGVHTLFRCFSASQEVLFPSVYKQRKSNTNLVAMAAVNKAAAVDLVLSSIPKKCEILRVHVAGDFKTLAYFDLWLEVARQRPDILFYAYTKSIPFWIKRRDVLPANFILTASMGGKYDKLAIDNNLRSALVVFSEAEARELNLEIDHDDYLAATHGKSFALLLHGVQPKGTKAGEAWAKIKYKQGGYSKKSNPKDHPQEVGV